MIGSLQACALISSTLYAHMVLVARSPLSCFSPPLSPAEFFLLFPSCFVPARPELLDSLMPGDLEFYPLSVLTIVDFGGTVCPSTTPRVSVAQALAPEIQKPPPPLAWNCVLFPVFPFPPHYVDVSPQNEVNPRRTILLLLEFSRALSFSHHIGGLFFMTPPSLLRE